MTPARSHHIAPAKRGPEGGRRRPRCLVAVLLSVLVLAGCSTLGFFYERLDDLALLEAERWLDLDREQALRLRARVDERLSGHRTQELPRYVAVLEHGANLIDRGAAPEDLLATFEQVQELGREAMIRSVPVLAPTFADLAPEQVQHFTRRLRESNEDFREEYLERPAADRRADRLESAEDGIERWTGRLDAGQRALLGRMIDAMPDNAPAWYQRRLAWQEGALELLRAGAPASAYAAWLEQWWRDDRDPDPLQTQREREAAATALAELITGLHPAQRSRASARLRAMAEELRALHGADPAPANAVARESAGTHEAGRARDQSLADAANFCNCSALASVW